MQITTQSEYYIRDKLEFELRHGPSDGRLGPVAFIAVSQYRG
jgi:hypothetical protein